MQVTYAVTYQEIYICNNIISNYKQTMIVLAGWLHITKSRFYVYENIKLNSMWINADMIEENITYENSRTIELGGIPR